MENKLSSEVHSAYTSLFKNNPVGQVVLDDLKAAHWFERSTFDENSRLHALREGERNVVLRMLAILASEPGDFINPQHEGR